jgi:hypothetical protein
LSKIDEGIMDVCEFCNGSRFVNGKPCWNCNNNYYEQKQSYVGEEGSFVGLMALFIIAIIIAERIGSYISRTFSRDEVVTVIIGTSFFITRHIYRFLHRKNLLPRNDTTIHACCLLVYALLCFTLYTAVYSFNYIFSIELAAVIFVIVASIVLSAIIQYIVKSFNIVKKFYFEFLRYGYVIFCALYFMYVFLYIAFYSASIIYGGEVIYVFGGKVFIPKKEDFDYLYVVVPYLIILAILFVVFSIYELLVVLYDFVKNDLPEIVVIFVKVIYVCMAVVVCLIVIIGYGLYSAFIAVNVFCCIYIIAESLIKRFSVKSRSL